MDKWQRKRNLKTIYLIFLFIFSTLFFLALSKPILIIQFFILTLLVVLVLFILLNVQVLTSIDFEKKMVHTKGLLNRRLINFNEVLYGRVYCLNKEEATARLYTKWIDIHLHVRNENLKELDDLFTILSETKKNESYPYRFYELIGLLTLRKYEKIHKLVLGLLVFLAYYLIVSIGNHKT